MTNYFVFQKLVSSFPFPQKVGKCVYKLISIDLNWQKFETESEHWDRLKDSCPHVTIDTNSTDLYIPSTHKG